MSLCIKCAAEVECEDAKTICPACIDKAMQLLTIDDCIDIRKRMERSFRSKYGKAETARMKAAGSL